jgi:hypothetical protein
MLVDELKELQKDSLLKYTNYPRLLTSQLLSDWVFTQYPKYFKEVVKIIVDGINIGSILNQDSRVYGGDEPISLPNECGRIEIIKECFEQLKHFPHNDYVVELIGLVANNPCEEILELWQNELKNISTEQSAQWLEYAYRMQIIHKIDKDILVDILLNDTELSSRQRKIQIVFNGNRFDVFDHNINLKQMALEGILSGSIFAMPHRRKYTSMLHHLSILLHPYIIHHIINETKNADGCFIDFIHNRFRFYDIEDEKNTEISKAVDDSNDDVDKLIKKFYEKVEDSLNSNLSEWKYNLERWDFLIEGFRDVFGNNWIFNILATIIAGIKDKELLNEEFGYLLNFSISLCKRVKYARTKSGDLNYWEQQFNQSVNLIFVCLVFFTWATPKVIIKLNGKLQLIVSQISGDDIKLLSNSLQKTTVQNKFTKKQYQEIIVSEQFNSLSSEVKYLISYRFPNETREDFLCSQTNEFSNIFNIDIIKLKFISLIGKYLNDVANKSLLNEIKEHYKLFSNYDYYDDEYIFRRYYQFHNNNTIIIPTDIAKGIMNEPISYPRIISSMAEKSCRLYANDNVNIVGKVATDNNWFE